MYDKQCKSDKISKCALIGIHGNPQFEEWTIGSVDNHM